MDEGKKQDTLEEVQGQFEAWRKKRTHRRPIPEELWRAAVSLKKGYSIYRIAKHLRLDFKELKNRMNGSKESDESAAAVTFIELDGVQTTECTVEMERADGVKMRISIKDKRGVDIIELGRAFWSNR